MTIPALRHLGRPFAGAPVVTQEFGHNWPNVEPRSWKSSDGSIVYYAAPGAVQGNWHSGIDYGLACGTTLLAVGGGTVHSAAWDTTGFGNLVILDHGGGLFSGYAHQQALEVHAGQAVTEGQGIGHVGSTGNSTGCHLHFFVCTPEAGYWRFLDPAPFILFPPPAGTHPAAPQPPQTAAAALAVLERRVALLQASHALPTDMNALVAGVAAWPRFSR